MCGSSYHGSPGLVVLATTVTITMETNMNSREAVMATGKDGLKFKDSRSLEKFHNNAKLENEKNR